MGLLPGEVRLGLAFALMVVPSVARADAELVVTHDDGASGCPETDEMRRLALAAISPSLPPPAHRYHVSFERSGASYRADVVDDTAARTRHLEDRGPGCGPLGQAVAEVLATMWSSERDDESPGPPMVVIPAPPSEVPVSVSGRPRNLRWVLGAGPALAAAIVRAAAPALVGSGAVEFEHAVLGLGVLWIPAQRIDVAPGSIDVQLLAGSAWGCAFLGGDAHLGLCAKMFAGALRGAASGYSADTQRGRPWFAIEPELYADHGLFWWVRARVAAGAIVPLHAETFSVTGAGSAYATPAVGGIASLSLEIATP